MTDHQKYFLTGRAIVAIEPNRVQLQQVQIPAPGDEDVQVRVTHSWISNGTESSYIRGERISGDTARKADDPWPFPHVPGYQKCGFRIALRQLEIDDNAALSPHEDTRPIWMTYGSSITHCGEAASPSFTWPCVVVRGRNLNLTCLGYGGQCHLDIGRMMRDLPADDISICAGINIYGHGSLNSRSFGSSLIGFVQLLREKHAKTPLALISPIYSFDRETTPNATGWTLQDYRDAVAKAAQTLQDYGDKNIIYVNGLDLFNKDLGHLMPDNLHPDAEGYVAMGENFLKVAAPRLFG